MFRFAQLMACLDESTWVTSAPAATAATLARPEYPKRFNTLKGFRAAVMRSVIQSQWLACSGKTPTWRELESCA